MKKVSTIAKVVFLGPSLLLYTIIVIGSVLFTMYYSLTNWNGIGALSFIGIKNFIEIFQDPNFIVSLKNTFICTGISLVVQIPVGLLLAYLLYRGIKGFKLFRAIYFLPVVISPIAIGLMFTLFLNNETGVLNNLLEIIGLESLQHAWLSDSSVVLYSVIAPQMWQYIGLYIIIFLAALQTIPDEVIESAQIDGASSTRIFFKIMIPLISSVVVLAVILCFTGSMKSFDYSWIMTGGGPGVHSSYLGVYMFKSAFVNSSFGIGSATNVVILLSALIFTTVFNKVTSKYVYE